MTTKPISQLIHRLCSETQARDAELTDSQLLDAFNRRRDETAFATLVRRHGPMVFGVCRRMLANVADAEDAFQATFLVLVRKAASIRRRALLANWLYGVACRTAMKSRTTNAKRVVREQRAARPEAIEADGHNDLLPLLDQELEKLPDTYRKAIVLCDLEGKTRKEAAQQLSWPEGTVATRLTRGRALLAKRLSKRGASFSGGALASLLAADSAAANVPLPLVSATVNAACGLADPAISPKVVTLLEGVLRTMLLDKIKTTGLYVSVLLVVSFSFGILMQQAFSGGQTETIERRAISRAAAFGDAKRIWQAQATVNVGGSVSAVKVSPNGKWLAVAGANKVTLFDVRLSKQLRQFRGKAPIAFSPDSQRIAVNAGGDSVLVYQVGNGQLTSTLGGDTKEAISLAFSPDGKRLAVGRGNPSRPQDAGSVTLWDIAAGQKLCAFALPEGGVYDVALSAKGADLYSFTSGLETSLKVWELKGGRLRRQVKGPGGRFLPITISNNQEMVATGIDPHGNTGEMDVKIWELATGKERMTVNRDGHSQLVQDLAFSPDNKLLASATSRVKGEKREGEVRIWEIATGKQTALFHGHSHEIRAITFTHDGEALITGSWDGTVKRWELVAANAKTGKNDWTKSKDGKLALHLKANTNKANSTQLIQLTATLKNLSNQPIHVIRPFGDWYVARAEGLDIRGRKGKLTYGGPIPDYTLGSDAFVTLKPGESVGDVMNLTLAEFIGFKIIGKYSITYDYAYTGNWDNVAKRAELSTDIWQGKIRSNTIKLEIVKGPRTFRGLNLDAAPKTIAITFLPDLFEEVPPGSKSYEIHRQVKVVYHGLDGTVFHRPDKKVFYIQSDPLASSTLTYYGPFGGDPHKILSLPGTKKAGTGKKPPAKAGEEFITLQYRCARDASTPQTFFTLMTKDASGKWTTKIDRSADGIAVIAPGYHRTDIEWQLPAKRKELFDELIKDVDKWAQNGVLFRVKGTWMEKPVSNGRPKGKLRVTWIGLTEFGRNSTPVRPRKTAPNTKPASGIKESAEAFKRFAKQLKPFIDEVLLNPQEHWRREIAQPKKWSVKRVPFTEAFKRVAGTLTAKERQKLILRGKVLELDRPGDCWAIENVGGFGNGLAGYIDVRTGRLIFLWIIPEG